MGLSSIPRAKSRTSWQWTLRRQRATLRPRPLAPGRGGPQPPGGRVRGSEKCPGTPERPSLQRAATAKRRSRTAQTHPRAEGQPHSQLRLSWVRSPELGCRGCRAGPARATRSVRRRRPGGKGPHLPPQAQHVSLGLGGLQGLLGYPLWPAGPPPRL